MKAIVRPFLDRYEDLFNRALQGQADMDEVASLYATEFIAAGPAGVAAGRNDLELKRHMAEGYARYRAIGTRNMRIRGVEVVPIDAMHCLAHVAWTATYLRDDLPETRIDFDVHYLIQVRDGEAKVFGWISGDEAAVLKQHGVT